MQEKALIQESNEFFSQNYITKYAAKCICNHPVKKYICRDMLFSNVGFNPDQFDMVSSVILN